MITDLLGVPDADADRFARYGTVIAGALDGIRSLGHAARLQAANRELRALFEELFELRRRSPADDVVSRIVAAEGDVRSSRAEMLPMCNLLLVAGFETTVNLVGNAVNALLRPPGPVGRRCAPTRPGWPRPAVEETLRWDPPVQRTARCAREDVELDGPDGAAGASSWSPCSAPPTATRRPTRTRTGSTSTATPDRRPPGLLQRHPLLRGRAAGPDGGDRRAAADWPSGRPDLRRAGPLRRRTSSVVRGPISLPVRAAGRASRLTAAPGELS